MKRLLHDTRAITAVEFAFAAPVLLTLMMGGLEIGHTMYVKAVLDGEVQKAARDLSLEDADASAAGLTRRAAIIARATTDIKRVINTADVDIETTAYHDYSDVSDRREPLRDTNHNNKCDQFEKYTDSNNNGTWDLDSGVDGAGNAKDVMLLSATVTYPRLALSRIWSTSGEMKLVSKTMLRNQPSTDQTAAPERKCPW